GLGEKGVVQHHLELVQHVGLGPHGYLLWRFRRLASRLGEGQVPCLAPGPGTPYTPLVRRVDPQWSRPPRPDAEPTSCASTSSSRRFTAQPSPTPTSNTKGASASTPTSWTRRGSSRTKRCTSGT